MKTQPNPVPQGQGIYCLIHRPTGSLYVGSSVNLRGRAYEWLAALKRGYFSHPHEEWEFVVVERTEGVGYNELRQREIELIEHARARGQKLLNRQTPAVTYRFLVDGLEGSATFHACRLGMNPSKVVDKLRRGYTIKQALNREPSGYDERQNTLDMMPVKIIHNGEPVTYAEAKKIAGGASNIKAKVKRLRARHPQLSEILLENLTNPPPLDTNPPLVV